MYRIRPLIWTDSFGLSYICAVNRIKQLLMEKLEGMVRKSDNHSCLLSDMSPDDRPLS